VERIGNTYFAPVMRMAFDSLAGLAWRARRGTAWRKWHCPDAVDAIAAESGLALAQPEYWIGGKTPRKRRNARGAGYGMPETNPAVERAAVRCVKHHYERQGYRVESREHSGEGYDLLCGSGKSVLHVEVEEGSGELNAFHFTPNELASARHRGPALSLGSCTVCSAEDCQSGNPHAEDLRVRVLRDSGSLRDTALALICMYKGGHARVARRAVAARRIACIVF
jgi:hypothetical protein